MSIDQYVRGEVTNLAAAVDFNVVPLNNVTLPAEDRAAMVEFQLKTAELFRMVGGSENVAEDLMKRVQEMKQVISNIPAVPASLMAKAEKLEMDLDNILWEYNGEPSKASPEEDRPDIPTINDRLMKLYYYQIGATQNTTQTMKDSYDRIVEKFAPVYDRLKVILDVDLKDLEKELEKYGAPAAKGRLPEWK